LNNKFRFIFLSLIIGIFSFSAIVLSSSPAFTNFILNYNDFTLDRFIDDPSFLINTFESFFPFTFESSNASSFNFENDFTATTSSLNSQLNQTTFILQFYGLYRRFTLWS